MNHAGERSAIVEICRRMYRRGLVSGSQGNVSIRSGNVVIITPSGVNKGYLHPADLAVADIEGRPLEGGPVSSEVKVHLAAYAARPDCMAVVHGHPKAAVAMTLAGIPLDTIFLPESAITLGPVPTASYRTPSSMELADGVGALARDHNVIMMERHGAVCLGSDVFSAYDRLESLEHNAEIVLTAHLAGRPVPLEDGEIEILRRIANGPAH